jgi:hypothetical protein
MIDRHLDTPIGKAGKIRTYSGLLVDPFQLSPDDIQIEDIAHSLSQLCRFTGHTRRFYSVAEHCLLVESILAEDSYSPKIRLGGLLHEGGEPYLGDMAGPTKRRLSMREYDYAEHRAAEVVMQKFVGDLTKMERALIKEADIEAYHIERDALMRPGPHEPYTLYSQQGLGCNSRDISFTKRAFLAKFLELNKLT